MNAKRVEDILQEQEDRLDAIKQLQEIWDKFPDLFREFASAIASGPTDKADQKEKPYTASAAVLHWLSENPDGGSAKDIVREMGDLIQTTSANIENVVGATIHGLKKRGRLQSDSRNGKTIYLLAKSPVTKHVRGATEKVPQKQQIINFLKANGPSHRQDIVRAISGNAIRNYLRKEHFDKLDDGRWAIRQD